MTTTNQQLLDLFEPIASDTSVALLKQLGMSELAAVSSAISLKRIADMLSAEELPPCFQNVNAYGENFAVALQEGIARGLRGVSQY